jgi:DNA replication protein DnaC
MFRREFIEPQEWPRVHGGPDMRTWAGAPFFVTLAGVVGSGKTMLATELLWRRLPHVQTASWWRAGTAISTVFGSFGEERARAAMCDLYDSELLVLDEIGRGHDGRAWGAIVEIISHRHEQHRETIFTTNRKIGTRQTGQDKERGLAEEDPALFRRLAEGAIVGLMKPWGGR